MPALAAARGCQQRQVPRMKNSLEPMLSHRRARPSHRLPLGLRAQQAPRHAVLGRYAQRSIRSADAWLAREPWPRPMTLMW